MIYSQVELHGTSTITASSSSHTNTWIGVTEDEACPQTLRTVGDSSKNMSSPKTMSKEMIPEWLTVYAHVRVVSVSIKPGKDIPQ